MKLQKIILAAALGLCSIGAFANWQPYVGGDFGVINSTFSTNINNPALMSNTSGSITDSVKGPYNFHSKADTASPEIQFGIANQYDKIYLGFGASVQYTNNIASSNTISDVVINNSTQIATLNSQITSSLHWNTSLTTQLGYFITPNFMPYAKVGLTIGQGDVTENINNIYTGFNTQGLIASSHATPLMLGPTASIGAQYTITQHIRGFAEANYSYLWGSATPNLNMTALGTTAFGVLYGGAPHQKYTYSAWTLKIGANYFF